MSDDDALGYRVLARKVLPVGERAKLVAQLKAAPGQSGQRATARIKRLGPR